MTGAFASAPALFDAGVTVLPIIPGTKKPPIEWTRWQRTPQCRDDVLRLAELYADHDVAVILGPSDLVDIEDDAPTGTEALAAVDLPPTATFASRRGAHRLYRSQWRVPLHGPGFELRAGRQYSIAPESTGRRWVAGRSLADAVELPGDALERLREIATRGLRGIEALEARAKTIGIEEGARNTSLSRLLGRWRTQGMDEEVLRMKAIAYAKQCRPPMDQLEALRTVTSLLNARAPMNPFHQAGRLQMERRLSPAATVVLLGLLVLRHELGHSGRTIGASYRMIQRYTGLTRHDTITAALNRLEAEGLVRRGRTRDPLGRPTMTITLLRPLW